MTVAKHGLTPTPLVCKPTLVFLHGGGDWCYSDEVPGGGELYVRLDGEGRVVEVYLNRNGAEIKGADLRAIRLDRMRALSRQRPDLAQFALDWDAPDVHGEVKKAFPPGWIDYRPDKDQDRVVLTPTSPDAGLTPEFLQLVADAYRTAVREGRRPNKALADQCSLSPRTVQRWVYLARKGGFLAPTTPGSVG